MGAPTVTEWNQMFQVYSITSLVLLVKYFVTMMYAINPDDHPDEDEKIMGVKEVPSDIKRRKRTAANDTENIPLHFAIFWAAFVVQNFCNASGNGQNETMALTCLIMIYTGFRGLFTLCYIFALQPWRTLSFISSQMTVFATAIILVVSAFQVDFAKIYPSLAT
jgi:uncharacterized MAPEG superfamily protein